MAREDACPTGLPTLIPVAIPHADPIHVLKPGRGVAVLAHPVRFGEMGDAGTCVDARVVVMILVQDPNEQGYLLTQLITVFQRSDCFYRLEQATDLDTLVAVFDTLLIAEVTL